MSMSWTSSRRRTKLADSLENCRHIHAFRQNIGLRDLSSFCQPENPPFRGIRTKGGHAHAPARSRVLVVSVSRKRSSRFEGEFRRPPRIGLRSRQWRVRETGFRPRPRSGGAAAVPSAQFFQIAAALDQADAMDVRRDHRRRRHPREVVGLAGKNPVEAAVLEIAIRDSSAGCRRRISANFGPLSRALSSSIGRPFFGNAAQSRSSSRRFRFSGLRNGTPSGIGTCRRKKFRMFDKENGFGKPSSNRFID